MNKREKIYIVSPIFCGGGSGAAIYYNILADSLQRNGFDVTIITDKEECKSKLKIIKLFPVRSSRKKNILSYFYYFIQNLTYLRLPFILFKGRPSVVIVHSSFFNYPGIFYLIMRLITYTFRKIKFVVDVRDRGLCKKRIYQLDIFNSIVACSKNIENHLLHYHKLKPKIHHIPIIQEDLSNDYGDSSVVFGHDLRKIEYILYAGLINESKKVDILLDSFINYVYLKNENIKFILCGIVKTNNKRVVNNLKHKGVIFLGNVDRDNVLKLMHYSSLCINISPIEGLPRSSLEPIAMGKPVILPPFVPEFKMMCPSCVLDSSNYREIGQKILSSLDNEEKCDYPIVKHSIDNILPKYMHILSSKVK